jgi:hypothetical protein
MAACRAPPGLPAPGAEAMAQLERIGENQEAFYYQVTPADGNPGRVMRATFYGSAAVSIGFLRPQSPAQG